LLWIYKRFKMDIYDLEVGIMGLYEKKKKEYRPPWFPILIMILIVTIVFESPAKPPIPGSFPWFFILFAFFVSLAIGVYLGLRAGKSNSSSRF